MTTADERTRTILQTSEFLEELMAQRELPDDVRREARRLLRHYPGRQELWAISLECPRMIAKPPPIRE